MHPGGPVARCLRRVILECVARTAAVVIAYTIAVRYARRLL